MLAGVFSQSPIESFLNDIPPWIASAATIGALLAIALATAPGRRVLAWSAGALLSGGSWALTQVCVAIERSLTVILQPATRDGSVPLARVIVWGAANIVVLALVVGLGASIPVTVGAGLFAAIHGLVILTALLIVNEESDVMDGILLRGEKAFAENSPPRKVLVLAPSTIFLVSAAAALFYRLDSLHDLGMVVNMPTAACDLSYCTFATYLLVTVEQMPGAEFIVGSHHIAFQAGWGKVYQGAVHLSATLLIFAAFIALWKQYKQIRSLMVAFDEHKNPEDVKYLHMRASRAPSAIRRWIAYFAVNHPNSLTRQRMLVLVRHLRIFSFLPSCLYRLHLESNDLKRRQLDTVEHFLEDASDDVDDAILRATLATLRHQTESQWGAHGEGVHNRLDRLTVRLSQLAAERELEDFAEGAPRRRLIDIAVWNHQDLGTAAAPLAEAVDSVTLCHRLISALNKLPPQEQTRAVHLCAQIVGRKGSSWKLKHLDGLKSLVARMKKSANNDNDLKMGLEDVASEVIRARARRITKVTDATPEDRVA